MEGQGMDEYPKMMYHPEKDPIIVASSIFEKERLNEGWSTLSTFIDERELLILKIKEYESELVKFKDRLNELTVKPEKLIEEPIVEEPIVKEPEPPEPLETLNEMKINKKKKQP